MVGPNFKSAKDQKYKYDSAAVNQNEAETNKGMDFHVIFRSRSIQMVIFIASLIGVLVLVPMMISYFSQNTLSGSILDEDNNCGISLVESIPEGLVFNGSSPNYLSTYNAWMTMLKQAKHSVKIVSFYWVLNDHNQKSAKQGEDILKEILIVLKRGVKVTIIQNIPTAKFPDKDSEVIKQAGAEVLDVDMYKFFGNGVLHTKFWVIDDETMYVGSANTDWRSLTQVKELGVLVTSCKSLIEDALKIVGVYIYAAINNRLPTVWPREFRTKFNKDRPLDIKLNGTDSKVYLTSSPRELCPSGRTAEIDAILDVIKKAKIFVNIAVMDYAPIIAFQTPKRFWPLIDDALRSAAFERKLQINFLGSIWSQTKTEMLQFLKSLAILNDVNSTISIKLFCIPSNGEQKLIPHARVNHNKYMVTDNAAYISNSNWLGDYFVNTAGVSIVVNQTSDSKGQGLYSQLHQVFVRDWTSEHSVDIWDVKSISYTCD